jgi:hypothetical protein
LARRSSARRRALSSPFCLRRLRCRQPLLDILEPQSELLGIELLGAAAELRALQLAQQMPKAINLRRRLVALGNRGVPFRPCCRKQRLQRADVGGKLRMLIYDHVRH